MKKEINQYFLTLEPEEGYMITNYTDDKDIKDYISFSIMCMPLGSDIRQYYEITIEKDAEYKELQEQALQAPENSYFEEEKEMKDEKFG